MSSISIAPNPSGTGIFTVAAPNSNTNQTLTLPDASGTLNASGTANEVPVGSASAPAIYPTGDTNTGIFFPAADTIAFTEGGAEAARFDSSGNALFGTTTNANNSRIVSNGVVQSTTGGFRFPDGTTQTTAAVAPTTAAVLTATAGASTGAVGTYGFFVPVDTSTYVEGSTYAGSILRYSNGLTSATQPFSSTNGGTPAGTWRAMGRRQVLDGNNFASSFAATLFLRIS